MSRKPIPKALRFAILERDDFTCQYCGAKPPNGALELDHIIPVCDGGVTEAENLITACEPCNSGKGRKKKRNLPIPDMTELAKELEGKRKGIKKYRREYALYKETVAEAARDIARGVSIAQHMIEKAINTYGVGEVEYAAEVTAQKIDRQNYEGQTAYFFGVLKNRRSDNAPQKANNIPRPDCPYGLGRCWVNKDIGMGGADDGCIVINPNTNDFRCCTALLEAVGGWDYLDPIMRASRFARVWRQSGQAVLDYVLTELNGGSQ